MYLFVALGLLLAALPARGEPGDCAQPVSAGARPTASDCLFVLRAAVATEACAPVCSCDADGNGGVTAPDALLCLQRAVGHTVTLRCPCFGPLIDEFTVNAYATGSQFQASVAADASGNFVVVWSSNGSSGTDTKNESIQAQRFAADGAPVGTQFQVNTNSIGRQVFPRIAMNVGGDFVVTWHALEEVFAQRFERNGLFVGTEFQVNTLTENEQWYADVALDADGNFVVVWDSTILSAPDPILAQRFAIDGSRAGTEFEVTSEGSRPAVAFDGSGRFLVAWGGGDTGEIRGRRFRGDGTPLGSEFGVDTDTRNGNRPDVAASSSGAFVITWEAVGDFGDQYEIRARRFGADGTALGTEFQVNTYTTSDQKHAAVTMHIDESFTVVWSDQGWYGPVAAQRFASDAQPYGTEIRVNADGSPYGRRAEVAAGPHPERFVVVWESRESTQYPYIQDVKGRLFGEADAALR